MLSSATRHGSRATGGEAGLCPRGTPEHSGRRCGRRRLVGDAPARAHKLITEDIPARVAADTAYQNAQKNSDKQNACIEDDKALTRVMTAVLKDDTELFNQFMDNELFRRWLTDTVFGLTYETALSPCKSDNTTP